MTKLGGILAVAMLAGCSTTIDADDYARGCADTSECVVISVGDICDCACEWSAINVADFERYQDDRSSISCNKQCEPCPEAPDSVCRELSCTVE